MNDTTTAFSFKCEEIAKEIDRLAIQKDYAGLNDYLSKVEAFSASHDTPDYAPIFYYLGTGKGTLASNAQSLNSAGKDSTAKECRKWALFYLRKAFSLLKQSDGDSALLLSLYTNYANELDACGRVIEALRVYRKAIALNPKFGMLMGNYGRVLNTYANMVNDAGHYKELHCYAYQAIKRAVSLRDPNMHKEAICYFEKMIKNYESLPTADYITQPIAFKKYDLGTEAEREYRMWCLNHHLFLNPLNDVIEQESAFAHDPLTITQFTEDIGYPDKDDINSVEPPKWYSMLNQLKEEYVYSRYLCYEGTEKSREVHYADKEVKLALSSFSYVNYSIRLEQLKSAFKNLFSIFDQISFVINDFWNLGYAERQANASHVFLCDHYPMNNLALSALQWSFYEFSEKFGGADNGSERNLKVLRNALEHKFVKIHEYTVEEKLRIENDGFYHISEEDLKAHVLRLLELSREWIMELVYAIGIEESRKEKEKPAVHLSICDYADEWKV